MSVRAPLPRVDPPLYILSCFINHYFSLKLLLLDPKYRHLNLVFHLKQVRFYAALMFNDEKSINTNIAAKWSHLEARPYLLVLSFIKNSYLLQKVHPQFGLFEEDVDVGLPGLSLGLRNLDDTGLLDVIKGSSV